MSFISILLIQIKINKNDLKIRATVLYLKIKDLAECIKVKDNHMNQVNRHMRFFFL